MKLYCIIVTYNGSQWIDRCLQSLRGSKLTVTPLIVDNGSTDGTLDAIQDNYPECIVLPQKQNSGFGQGNNIGMEYALAHDATHVLLLNQDAAIQPETLERLLACDDGKHLLTPVHLNGDGSRIDGLFYKQTIIASAQQNGLAEDFLLSGNGKQYYDVEYANAACWLLPVELIRQIGGFNPLFTQYGEDDNYMQRVLFHGYGVRLVPGAFIYHDRKTHGNEAVYKKGSLYRKLLLVETNIRLGRAERFAMRHKVCLQEFGAALLAHRTCEYICEWIAAKWTLCRNRARIRNSRNIESRKSANWLN